MKKKTAAMGKEWIVTQADFDALLKWLHPDRESAGRKYEEIRSRLVQLFVCRGSPIAEELADRTIDRVIRKLPDFAQPYSGNPALYFYGVAKNIYHESLRSPVSSAVTEFQTSSASTQVDDTQLNCLEKCMSALPSESRRLVLSYYEQKGRAKIDNRKKLAEELGIDMNTLRIRTHRIRARLEECVRRCIDETK